MSTRSRKEVLTSQDIIGICRGSFPNPELGAEQFSGAGSYNLGARFWSARQDSAAVIHETNFDPSSREGLRRGVFVNPRAMNICRAPPTPAPRSFRSRLAGARPRSLSRRAAICHRHCQVHKTSPPSRALPLAKTARPRARRGPVRCDCPRGCSLLRTRCG